MLKFLSNHQQGVVYAVGSGLFYSLVGYFGISLINFHLSVPNMLFWRFLAATILSIAIMLPKYKKLVIKQSDIKMLLSGILFYGASTITFFVSAKRIGTSVATAILFAYPIFVILSNAILCKTKLKKNYYIVFFVLLAGITCLISAHGLTLDVVGISSGILSSFCCACYIIAGKKSTSKPMMSTVMTSIGCTTTCFVAAWVDGSFCIPGTINIWLTILATAALCTVIPILLFLQALEHIDAETASILSVSELVFIVIFGYVLLHESLNSMQIIGITVIIIGTLITLVRHRRLEKALAQLK